MPKPAQNVTNKYLEVFMPLPQKYTIETTGNNFELYCHGHFVYANQCLEQIFVIYGRLMEFRELLEKGCLERFDSQCNPFIDCDGNKIDA